MSPRPLVLHDAFAFPGGGELVAVTLARAFGARLLAGAESRERLTSLMSETLIPEAMFTLPKLAAAVPAVLPKF